MPLPENKAIIACAGSGKTSRLVDEALADRTKRIAIVTYTNNNAQELRARFNERNSGVPPHVEVMTWFQFLLRECARPYQRSKYADQRIESLFFVARQSTRFVLENDTRRYYFHNGSMIYSDKIAKFVVECESNSSKAVTSRLGEIYTDIFIDEFQDLAGWDLEVVEALLTSRVRVTLVGDPRQHIYSTNPSNKNKKYLGAGIIQLLRKWEKRRLCSVEQMNHTYRCNQRICEFTNALWHGMEEMISLQHAETGHDGVFLVAPSAVREYFRRFSPQVLRYNKLAKTYDHPALNFGESKGLQFSRVLVIPTAPITKYLETGAIKHVEKSRDKLHVAVTRAAHSVAFVHKGESPVVSNRWQP